MALEHYKTQILLLHSEQSKLDTLSSGFSDRYSVHCATTGSEALSTLGVTPIHVIVSAQDLPGMSGLDALREAKKRSPETIGILLAGKNQNDGLEALVGDKEVFQIVRGEISPEALRDLIDTATKRARLIALSESANDTAANVDEPMGEHIVMETSENGSTIISDGTGTMPALKPQKIQLGADVGSRGIDILVLTKDDEFLSTIRDSARGLHKVFHAHTPAQAEGFFKDNKIGVLVTDAAMVGSNIEALTQRMRAFVPRLVAIVAGRRDDGELLMDLINRGQVYRFLLKPVSPGRARLAIEASVKHHLESAESAFKPAGAKPPVTPTAPKSVAGKPAAASPARTRPAAPGPVTEIKPHRNAPAKAAPPPAAKPAPVIAKRKAPTISDTPISVGLDDAFGDDSSFTETMTGIAASIGKSLTGAMRKEPEAAPKTSAPDRPAAMPAPPSVLRSPKMLAAAAGLVVLLVLGTWILSGPDEAEIPTAADVAPRQATQTATVPQVAESEVPVVPSPSTEREIVSPAYAELLDEARIARDAGEIITPPGSSAIELYLEAREAAPGDEVIARELSELVSTILGMAETALLAQKVVDADAAIRMVRRATPANPRLPFLDAQLAQLKYRSALGDARAAIRDKRFEDAAQQIANARSVAGVDQSDVRLLTQELAHARSERRIEEVLGLAASRVEEDRLTSPSNDNARYYYELALSTDSTNTAAQQGLVIVASKLVLKARAAIDTGRLDQAAEFLRDARTLDPSNTELTASTAALETARQAIVDAERRSETERLAAIEREAAAARQQEADRLAELESQAARLRQLEAEKLAEQEQLANAARQAEQQAATVEAAPFEQAAADSGNESITVPRPAGESIEPEVSRAAVAQKVAQADRPRASGTTARVANEGPKPIEIVGVNTLNRIQYVSPKYPRSAMRRGVTGYVDIELTVARDGSVKDVRVTEAKPADTFDEAAIDAVQQWRFEPVIERGIAVEKRTAVRMAFEIQ